jgi:hypothetical protein
VRTEVGVGRAQEQAPTAGGRLDSRPEADWPPIPERSIGGCGLGGLGVQVSRLTVHILGAEVTA